MTALERIAWEIGTALAECGAEESSTFVGELAEALARLEAEPSSREGRRRGLRRRWPRRSGPGPVESR